MAEGPGRIGLNEATFGSSLFAGSIGMLRFAVGDPAASQVALTGALYEAPAAAELGLVDALVRVTSYWRRPDRAPWHLVTVTRLPFAPSSRCCAAA